MEGSYNDKGHTEQNNNNVNKNNFILTATFTSNNIDWGKTKCFMNGSKNVSKLIFTLMFL